MLYDISRGIICYNEIVNIINLNHGGVLMPYSGGPMTEAMYYVLLALMHPSHGYGLMTVIKEVSKGRIKMGPGTLYGVLGRMESDGLISLAENDGRRKTYKITHMGEEALLQEYKRLMALVEDGEILNGGI